MSSRVHSFAMAHSSPQIAEPHDLWWLSYERTGRSFAIVEADTFSEATAKAKDLKIDPGGGCVAGIALEARLGTYLLDSELNVLMTEEEGDALGERVLTRIAQHSKQEN